MHIYISGISGTGMGPLALFAQAAGFSVSGSDRAVGPITPELETHSIQFEVGEQDGTFLRQIHDQSPIDWFVYTSALPADHPELLLAKTLGLKITKRDQIISHLLTVLNLKMIAVAGTHGKTTTTSMLIWATKELGLPVSYIVGTTLGFASSGYHQSGNQYFIYEADEFDRNFLHFHPWLSLITNISYDHPDIYPTLADYQMAFQEFKKQSHHVIEDAVVDPRITLSGPQRRFDATLALQALTKITNLPATKVIDALNSFPGVGRRFERLAPGIYSDYAHHPEEISATLALAFEEAANQQLRGVIAVYQPHQNTRQHQVRSGYRSVFHGVTKLFWLPTFLSREDQSLPIISPAEFIQDLVLPPETAVPATMDQSLIQKLRDYQAEGYLILLMTAGSADSWLRQNFTT